MKLKPVFTLLALVTVLGCTLPAQAFYDVRQGRFLGRDPIGDEVFLQQLLSNKAKVERKLFAQQALGPTYTFVNNDALNHFDYLGLSGRDVLKMWAIFANTLQEYCKKCIRCDIPWLGNVAASAPWTSARGCTWQALDMHKRLLDNLSFKSDATWTLDTPNTGGNFFNHNWVSAESDDPSDPKVELDTWKGCITVTFPNATQASWKRCFKCPPNVPNESYAGPEYGP